MVWDALIACYLFLAGVGAGAFVLGALANWSKKPVPRLRKIAYVIAPVVVAVGTLLLMVDARAGFANPGRFFLLISNLNSVMAWGVIILSVFLAVAVVDAVLLFVRKKTPKALDIAGMVLAVCVAAYTGVLLGDAGVSFPLWNMVILPVLFVVSAASTGFAAVLLVTRAVAPQEADTLSFVSTTGFALPVLELALIAVLLVATAGVRGSAAEAAAASVGNLLSGSYAVPFWLGLVAVGLVLPFGVEMRRQRIAAKPIAVEGVDAVGVSASAGKTLALVGEAGVLVGGFMLRYLVIMAALPVTLL